MRSTPSTAGSVGAATYGAAHPTKRWSYWRVFFLSCAALRGYRGGEDWIVSHYLMETPRPAVRN